MSPLKQPGSLTSRWPNGLTTMGPLPARLWKRSSAKFQSNDPCLSLSQLVLLNDLSPTCENERMSWTLRNMLVLGLPRRRCKYSRHRYLAILSASVSCGRVQFTIITVSNWAQSKGSSSALKFAIKSREHFLETNRFQLYRPHGGLSFKQWKGPSRTERQRGGGRDMPEALVGQE